MRLKTNLEPYYKRMKLEEMNRLCDMMEDMRFTANSMNYLLRNYEFRLDRPKDWSNAKFFKTYDLIKQAQRIDQYMLSIQMESIFHSENKKKSEFQDNELREIIAKALWLRERTKTLEECLEIEREKNEKDHLLRMQFKNAVEMLKSREMREGMPRDLLALQKAEKASSIVAKLVGIDPVVAEGIAIGLEFATPPFDSYDETFFKESLAEGDYVTIGMTLTTNMLKDSKDERVNRIIAGVIAVLTNAEILSEEEKAAKEAHQ